jgi:hypothetical protein
MAQTQASAKTRTVTAMDTATVDAHNKTKTHSAAVLEL